MIINKKFVILLFLVIFLLISIISAEENFLLCLTDGQEIEFSKCNENMQDYRCEDTKCHICVIEISRGIYCPVNIGNCNSQCIPLELYENEDPIITLKSPVNFYRTNEGILNIKFDITKNHEVSFCELIINNQIAEKITLINPSNEFTHSFNENAYLWKVSCKTLDGKVILSEPRTLFIEKVINSTENTNSQSNNQQNTIQNNSQENNQQSEIREKNEQDIIIENLKNQDLNEDNVLINLSNKKIELENKKENSLKNIGTIVILLFITILNFGILIFLNQMIIRKK